tara:strand:+ start:406 stop:780 length:375 start_codon:yes stop_codon:yes gene_type:complete
MKKKTLNQQDLPNSSIIFSLGIVSLLLMSFFVCLGGGLLGPILAVIALIMANKATKFYKQDKDIYTESSFTLIKIGKITAIVSLVWGVINIMMALAWFGFWILYMIFSFLIFFFSFFLQMIMFL